MLEGEAHALLAQDLKGFRAMREESRLSLRQRLDLVDIFAEVRGSLGHIFKDTPFYDERGEHRGKRYS